MQETLEDGYWEKAAGDGNREPHYRRGAQTGRGEVICVRMTLNILNISQFLEDSPQVRIKSLVVHPRIAGKTSNRSQMREIAYNDILVPPYMT